MKHYLPAAVTTLGIALYALYSPPSLIHTPQTPTDRISALEGRIGALADELASVKKECGCIDESQVAYNAAQP